MGDVITGVNFRKASLSIPNAMHFVALTFLSGKHLVVPVSSAEADRVHLAFQNVEGHRVDLVESLTGHVTCVNFSNVVSAEIFFETVISDDNLHITSKSSDGNKDISDSGYISFVSGDERYLLDFEGDSSPEVDYEDEESVEKNPLKVFIYNTWVSEPYNFLMLDVGSGEYLHLNMSHTEFISFVPWHLNPDAHVII